MREKFARFMMGRYGNDRLNQCLLPLAMILLILSWFTTDAFYMVAVLILVYAYYRMFSKNTYKRYAENQRFVQWECKMKGKLNKKKKELSQLKTHHIYKCPNCKQKIRVPRGRGKIAISCRKCGTEFIKKS